MRGSVYRYGRRRTGSVLAAFGVASAFALGSVSGASAKTVTPVQVIAVPVHVVPVQVIAVPVHVVLAQVTPAPVHVVPVAPPKPPTKVVQVVQVVQTVQNVQNVQGNPIANTAGHKVA